MNGHVFSDHIVITDVQFGWFIPILQVGCRLPHSRELINMISRANACGPLDDHMGFDLGALTDLNLGPDQ